MARPLVITLCSSRKLLPPQIAAANLKTGTQAEVCAEWLGELRRAAPQLPAAELYRGRAFGAASRAAKLVGADLAIISAGLGVVMSSTVIPSYDLTLARGGIANRISEKFDFDSWWLSIARGPYAANLHLELHDRSLVLVCLSRNYAPLIASALEDVPTDRLRIFGTSLERVLPAKLAGCILPYDQRLEVATSAGTRSDFAQRALLHYVTDIRRAHPTRLDDDLLAVRAAFARTPYPHAIPKRAAAADDAIRSIIIRLLPSIGRRRSPMLRHLRDVEGVACEQSRFARLFAEVAHG